MLDVSSFTKWKSDSDLKIIIKLFLHTVLFDEKKLIYPFSLIYNFYSWKLRNI